MDEKQIDDYLKGMGVVEGLRLFARQIYLAGRTEQARLDREAVEKLDRWGVRWDEDDMVDVPTPHPADLTFLEKDIFAALDAVKPEAK